MPMIIKKILINLLIVTTSKNSINRKRTFKNNQNELSLKLQNGDPIDDQPLDLSIKRNKIEESSIPESGNIIDELSGNFNDENIEKQLIGPLKKLMITTLKVLKSIFFIYKRGILDVEKCSKFELEKLKMKVFKYAKYLHQSESIITYRNFNIELSFTRYFQSFKHKSILDENFIKQSDDKLFRDLEETSIRSLFYTLIFAVKESGSTGPTGVITCALLILAVSKTDSVPRYRDFLIYQIIAHKAIALEKSQTNSDSKILKIKQIKDKFYKKMCQFLFPETNCVKYDEILHLSEKLGKKNYWFNEFSVILLMQYINGMHIAELDYIFRSLNNYKSTDNKKTNDLVAEYYLYMFMLFDFEALLVDKASMILFRI